MELDVEIVPSPTAYGRIPESPSDAAEWLRDACFERYHAARLLAYSVQPRKLT